jgi:hypothetical protein
MIEGLNVRRVEITPMQTIEEAIADLIVQSSAVGTEQFESPDLQINPYPDTTKV